MKDKEKKLMAFIWIWFGVVLLSSGIDGMFPKYTGEISFATGVTTTYLLMLFGYVGKRIVYNNKWKEVHYDLLKNNVDDNHINIFEKVYRSIHKEVRNE